MDEYEDMVADLVDIAQDTILDEEQRRHYYKRLIGLFTKLNGSLLETATGIDDLYDEVFDEATETPEVDLEQGDVDDYIVTDPDKD